MKKVAFHNIYPSLNKNNFLFENDNVSVGDDLLKPYKYLREEALKYGLELGTSDFFNINEIDEFVFIDMPKKSDKYFQHCIKSNIPMSLLIFESDLIIPGNNNLKLHLPFRKIYTWNDDLVDNKRYFKINYCFDLERKFSFDNENRKKFCTVISGNKYVKHENELYSLRKEYIRWFEDNHPDEFDLYGMGWDSYYFHGLFKQLNRFSFLKSLFHRREFSSYRGPIERKNKVLREYKFSICFENIKDSPGYITEKIFDCFFAGCVPVYLGANNIHEKIPEGCYISEDNFKTKEELYTFLKNMDESTFLNYQNNILNFLNSEKSDSFSISTFCKTIACGLAND